MIISVLLLMPEGMRRGTLRSSIDGSQDTIMHVHLVVIEAGQGQHTIQIPVCSMRDNACGFRTSFQSALCDYVQKCSVGSQLLPHPLYSRLLQS